MQCKCDVIAQIIHEKEMEICKQQLSNDSSKRVNCDGEDNSNFLLAYLIRCNYVIDRNGQNLYSILSHTFHSIITIFL